MSEIKRYNIKDGYQINPNPVNMAIPAQDIESVYTCYQSLVYSTAADILRPRTELATVLDVGCGYPYKLDIWIRPLAQDITGIDGREAVLFARENFPYARWIEADLTEPKLDLKRRFDLVICADVIEHIHDPDQLLDTIKRHTVKSSTIIISTPERDNARGIDHFGPPPNKTHIREWNQVELSGYLKMQGFLINGIKVVSDIDDPNANKNCLICICNLE